VRHEVPSFCLSECYGNGWFKAEAAAIKSLRAAATGYLIDMNTILIIVLIVLLVGGGGFGYSRRGR